MHAEEVGDPKNEILWFNSDMKIENKVAYYKAYAWREKNVIYIKDLLDHNGNLMSFFIFNENMKLDWLSCII